MITFYQLLSLMREEVKIHLFLMNETTDTYKYEGSQYASDHIFDCNQKKWLKDGEVKVILWQKYGTCTIYVKCKGEYTL